MKDHESNDLESAQVLSQDPTTVAEDWTPDAMEISFDGPDPDQNVWNYLDGLLNEE